MLGLLCFGLDPTQTQMTSNDFNDSNNSNVCSWRVGVALSRFLDAFLHFDAKEWKLRPCCLRLCFVLLVLLVAFLAVLSWPNNLSQNWKATVQRAERAVGLGAAPESYNCDVDFKDWKLAWSNTKSLGVGQVKGRGD